MNKLKKYEIPILSFIAALVIITLIGVTYAFFRARISNLESVSTIAVTSGEMTIEYENNTDVLTGTNIIPGWSATKTFTLKGKNTAKATDTNPDNNMYYKIGIAVDNNTFSEGALTYLLEKDPSSSDNGQMADGISGAIHQSGTKYIANGYFSTTSTFVNHVYKLTITFPDKLENQSYDNNKTFAAHITVGEANSPQATDYIAKLYDTAATENGLEKDDTDDQNIRYVGSYPKNYVEFGNEGELWRIIGIFNVEDSATGKTSKHLKLIRNESLGRYSWDTSASNVNSGYGVNDWTQADLMTELNGDYLDTSKTGTTNWYNGKSNQITGIYDYSKNIKENYQDMIASVKWNLGGCSNNSVSAKNMYSYERGTTIYTGRSPYFKGDIALIYPSDYGYASTNTSCRSNLASTSCKNENWLYNSSTQWTLSQISSYAHTVFGVSYTGSIYYYGYNSYFTYSAYEVRPTVYLESNIQITSGSGEMYDPYILG